MSDTKKPYSRDFKESEDAQVHAWVNRMDDRNIANRYASLHITMDAFIKGGSASVHVRLGPGELRALAKELVEAADFIDVNQPKPTEP